MLIILGSNGYLGLTINRVNEFNHLPTQESVFVTTENDTKIDKGLMRSNYESITDIPLNTAIIASLCLSLIFTRRFKYHLLIHAVPCGIAGDFINMQIKMWF